MITIQKIITLLLPYYLFTLIICMLCHKPINGTPRAVRHHLSKHYRIPQGTQFRITNELQTEIAGFLWISWCRGWFIVVVARYDKECAPALAKIARDAGQAVPDWLDVWAKKGGKGGVFILDS